MHLQRFALVGVLLLAVSLTAEAAQGEKGGKIDPDKLIGTWTFVKTDGKDAPPPGAVLKVTFSKGGKMTVAFIIKEKELKANGTWKVKGDQLTTVLTDPSGKESKEEVATIKELTDKKFVTVEKKDGKTETTEFKK